MEWELDRIGEGNTECIKHFSDQDWRLEIIMIVIIIISVIIKSIL